MSTVRLSSKGQIVIPKAIRQSHGWRSGQEFVINEKKGGLLLRPRPLFPPTTVEEVFGCLAYEGPPRSIEEMNEAVQQSVRAQWSVEGNKHSEEPSE